MKSSTKNIVCGLPHELPKDLRLTILGNSEIMGKTQKWVEAEPSTQSPLQKINFGTTVQKLHKNRYQSFSFCPVLLDFFVSLILSAIVILDFVKYVLSDDNWDIPILMDCGNCLRMLGGWLEYIFIDIDLLFSLRNGLYTVFV